MKKRLIIALLTSTLLLSGCGLFRRKTSNPSGDTTSNISGDTSENPSIPVGGNVTIYLSLGEIGLYEGQKGNDYPDMFLENAIKLDTQVGAALPGKDKITSTSGAEFANWMAYEGTGAPVKYDTAPNENNKILYANWSGGSGTNTSQGGGSESTTDAHGPEGSELVSWYIVGEGSLWSTAWNVSSAVQMYSNPGHDDKGCILNISFQVGDTFQVADGDQSTSTWYGWSYVDKYDDPSNKGISNFEGVDNGFGSLTNIRCTVAGAYDMYVNKDGKIWIQAH